MTQETLCTGTTQDIDDLIQGCNFPPDAYLLVEKLPQQVVKDDQKNGLLRFAHVSRKDEIDISSYTSGRIFNKDFELHWEKQGETTRVVYLGKGPGISGLTGETITLVSLDEGDQPSQQTGRTLKLERSTRKYYLFGEYLDKTKLPGVPALEKDEHYYTEVRIPRLLSYPVSGQAQRVQLVVCEYRDRETGQVKLFRFKDLRAAE